MLFIKLILLHTFHTQYVFILSRLLTEVQEMQVEAA